ncbi:uncharacterized protein LOC119576584 [Penaeus monodon]|uniref:uncharacterized protein LOC119576584 n=1 Tax=Penaeus monodon TaxID=6687 RepID=UPI0018A79A12|nr:uncharacterized protein LOC119576584 [Penaeus monodon]
MLQAIIFVLAVSHLTDAGPCPTQRPCELAVNFESDVGPGTMDVSVNYKAGTIQYSLRNGTAHFGGTRALEDYAVGLAISIVENDNACYWRKLRESFQRSLGRLLSPGGRVLRIADPTDARIEPTKAQGDEVGRKLASFCGNRAIYRLLDGGSSALDDAATSSPNALRNGLKRDVASTTLFSLLSPFILSPSALPPRSLDTRPPPVFPRLLLGGDDEGSVGVG